MATCEPTIHQAAPEARVRETPKGLQERASDLGGVIEELGRVYNLTRLLEHAVRYGAESWAITTLADDVADKVSASLTVLEELQAGGAS